LTTKAPLFEKSSKNSCPFGVRVRATRTPYKQKFFGSFSQKRTASFRPPAAPLVAIQHESDLNQPGIIKMFPLH
jgi:hypothetical protein